MTNESIAELADDIERVTLAVPGVVGMHGGAFGEVGTYLPGRRVTGVRIGPRSAEVHLVLSTDSALLETAAAVREAVAPLVSTPVDVFVDDVV